MALKAEEVYAILKKQIQSGGATPEQIQQAVDNYLEENPVQPGATVEQAAQIEKNKSDISSVKEDVSSLSEDISNVGLLSDYTIKKTDLQNEIIEELSKNIFGEEYEIKSATPLETKNDTFMTSNGEYKETVGRYCKIYFIENIKSPIRVYDFAGGTIPLCVFLDYKKTLISANTTGGWTSVFKDIDIPEGSSYVVVNATDSPDNVKCEIYSLKYDSKVDEKLNVLGETIEKTKNSVNELMESVYGEKQLIELTNTNEDTKGFITTDGTLSGDDIPERWHKIYNVDGYKKIIVIDNCAGGVKLCVFLDNNNRVISTVDGNATLREVEVNVPVLAKIVSVNSWLTSDTSIKCSVYEYVPKSVEEQVKESNEYISFEIEQAQNQIVKTQKMNDFVYSKFDKSYFVLTIDDANKYLAGLYDLCHSLSIPLCPAIIPSQLDVVHDTAGGRSTKSLCDLIVTDGGEILSHSGKFITEDSTKEDYKEVFRDTKKQLEDAGYTVRGIITAGGADYLSNDIRLDNWSRKYYDYSDQNGLNTSKAYWHPRWWFHDVDMNSAKEYIDDAITNKTFIVAAMHGTDDPNDLEYVDNVKELLQYIISKGEDSIKITTWSYVYDTFKSSVLEEKIKKMLS